MDFTQAIRSCFSQYATFQGRSPRSEFWYFALFTTSASIVIRILDALTFGFNPVGPGVLDGLFSLAVFLPTIAVSVRRLHDIDRSGWWWWLWLIPIIGWIVLLIWMITVGNERENSHGPDPLGGWVEPGEATYTHKSSIPTVTRDD
jgi:uncharacterized membrane protein YhaH (DUF805 family)